MESLILGLIKMVDEHKLLDLFLVSTRLKVKMNQTHIRKEANKEIIVFEPNRVSGTQN